MITFTEIELHHQWIDFNEEERTYRGIMTPSQDFLVDLIAANTEKKLREFTAQWFPFMDFRKSWKHPTLEDEITAVSDTRNLMLLVLELKRMIDEKECTREDFEKIGVSFDRGGAEGHESASLHYLVTSTTFCEYIRSSNECERIEESYRRGPRDVPNFEETLREWGHLDKSGNIFCPHAVLSYAPGSLIIEDHLYLGNQEEMIKSIDPEKRYPVMNFFGGNLGKSISCSPERAYWFIDRIFNSCIQGVRMQTRNGILAPQAYTNFTSFWICLSDSFRESRVTACKTCGLPIIVTKERGAKRLYCDDSCKRKYKRALKFASLVNEESFDEQAAAKESGMAAATAVRILARNGITIDSAR
jgi:hypothetical protein